MKNVMDDIKSLLQKDERLVSEGELLKNKIIELAIKLDKKLIKLLLSSTRMKEVFFSDIDGTLIFDKDKFIRFVSNKQFLPDSYTVFKNKIGLTLGDDYLSEKKEVVLSWPYKDCVLVGGMTKEDQKRDEIFWNEILAPDEISRLFDPKVFTNAKRIDKKGEHKLGEFRTDKNGDIKDNLIIKGNNLLVLHSLKRRFAGKVKLIYIDLPFNKKGDTFYNDQFKRSTWLTFMKNRLEVAWDLLKDDGFIFIHIDDEQQAYLKVLCDSIFNEDHLVNVICLKSGQAEGVKMTHKENRLVKFKEYILFYAKNKTAVRLNPQYMEKMQWDKRYNNWLEKNNSSNCRDWVIHPLSKKLEEMGLDIADEDEIGDWKFEHADNIVQLVGHKSALIKNTKGNKRVKELKTPKGLCVYAIDGKKILFASNKIKNIRGERKLGEYVGDLWTDISYNNLHNEGGVDLPNGKKPEALIQRIIDLTTNNSDLILDFFLGCGTTAAVAHKMRRQYVGVEQLDYGKNDSVVRLKNVIKGDSTGISKSVGWKGGGDFVYLELMKWNEKFVEEIQKAKMKDELEKLWDTMKEKAFLSFKVDTKAIDENIRDFADLSIESQKKYLFECLDKNHIYVSYSEIDDEEYGISMVDKKLNRKFYES